MNLRRGRERCWWPSRGLVGTRRVFPTLGGLWRKAGRVRYKLGRGNTPPGAYKRRDGSIEGEQGATGEEEEERGRIKRHDDVTGLIGEGRSSRLFQMASRALVGCGSRWKCQAWGDEVEVLGGIGIGLEGVLLCTAPRQGKWTPPAAGHPEIFFFFMNIFGGVL